MSGLQQHGTGDQPCTADPSCNAQTVMGVREWAEDVGATAQVLALEDGTATDEEYAVAQQRYTARLEERTAAVVDESPEARGCWAKDLAAIYEVLGPDGK